MAEDSGKPAPYEIIHVGDVYSKDETYSKNETYSKDEINNRCSLSETGATYTYTGA